MQHQFDVFLSHNSADKLLVKEIAAYLIRQGLRVWLDEHELRPGFPWQEGIEEGVKASRAVAVLVGENGLGAWQEPEMRAFLTPSRRERIPVIPVLLPGCPDSPQLTLLLEAMTWVDLRGGLTEEALSRLVWGITGTKSDDTRGSSLVVGDSQPRKYARPKESRRRRWTWGIAFSLLAVILTVAAWLWLRPSKSVPPPAKPQIYALRVQVVDPENRPVVGATVRASTGNEPQRTPDGWWEVEIPGAKVPADGQISLWAEHEEWEGSRVDLRLGGEPNPRAVIQLRRPESLIRGQVVDASGRGLSGWRVFRQGGASGTATSDGEGHFELAVSVPRETKVRLRAEHGTTSGETFCFAGRDTCSIVVEEP